MEQVLRNQRLKTGGGGGFLLIAMARMLMYASFALRAPLDQVAGIPPFVDPEVDQ